MRHDGSPGPPLSRKSWGLLAYLALARGRKVPREELAALLWPRSREGQARASLRQELSVLRRTLRAASIGTVDSGTEHVSLHVCPGEVDVLALESLLRSGRDASVLREVWAIYRGDLMGDLSVRSGPFEDWLWLERHRLRNAVLEALQTLLHSEEASGVQAAVTDMAEALLRIEPTQESAYRALMRGCRDNGRLIEALRLYRRCEEVLARELDTVPSLETRALADEIRQEVGRMASHAAAPRRRGWSVVLQIGLAVPDVVARGVDPDHLLEAQIRFGDGARRAIAAAGGEVFAGQIDRVVAVFEAGGAMEAAVRQAAETALRIVAVPVVLSPDLSLRARAGIAAGQVLISARPPMDLLIGAALLRASEACMVAGAGEVAVTEEIPPLFRAASGLTEAGAPAGVSHCSLVEKAPGQPGQPGQPVPA